MRGIAGRQHDRKTRFVRRARKYLAGLREYRVIDKDGKLVRIVGHEDMMHAAMSGRILKHLRSTSGSCNCSMCRDKHRRRSKRSANVKIDKIINDE